MTTIQACEAHLVRGVYHVVQMKVLQAHHDLLVDILEFSAQSCYAPGVLFRTQSGCKPQY
jgi:hypothetical protein